MAALGEVKYFQQQALWADLETKAAWKIENNAKGNFLQ